MFGSEPKEILKTMIDNDHPELDNIELLDQFHIEQYQSLIGALHLLASLGHLSVATISSFFVAFVSLLTSRTFGCRNDIQFFCCTFCRTP